jgi:dolichol-phosphate mannosyltransferase
LAVLIPAWNERPNLELLIPSLRKVISPLGIDSEIIVIDGGSRDGTTEAAARLGATVVIQQERGYGGALLAGFEATRARYIVTMDADLSHPPLFIQQFWKQRDEAEMLIASRYVPGGRAEMSGFRRLLSIVLNRTYGFLLSMPVRDLSSGYRLYRRELLAELRPVARDFDFLEEVLILIHHRGGRIREIPFHYMPRNVGRSHARLLKFGWAYVKTLARMWKLRHLG